MEPVNTPTTDIFSFVSFQTGKSNLMDAISFVLGEKTQHLRVRNLKVSRSHTHTHTLLDAQNIDQVC